MTQIDAPKTNGAENKDRLFIITNAGLCVIPPLVEMLFLPDAPEWYAPAAKIYHGLIALESAILVAYIVYFFFAHRADWQKKLSLLIANTVMNLTFIAGTFCFQYGLMYAKFA